ncbi:MAG: YccF domain-containing protein [Gammaproteobacteria bacterium]
MLRLIGNVLWFLLGGFFMGLAWWFVGLIAFVSIVGIPWGRACFVIGGFSFWPFGREAIGRRELTGREDFGSGPLGTVGNVVWLIVAGWWLALGHVISAVLDFITIIGIPFGIQHLKLAVISVWPIGVQVVPVNVAAATRARAYNNQR